MYNKTIEIVDVKTVAKMSEDFLQTEEMSIQNAKSRNMIFGICYHMDASKRKEGACL